jgi:hypothetical protein
MLSTHQNLHGLLAQLYTDTTTKIRIPRLLRISPLPEETRPWRRECEGFIAMRSASEALPIHFMPYRHTPHYKGQNYLNFAGDHQSQSYKKKRTPLKSEGPLRCHVAKLGDTHCHKNRRWTPQWPLGCCSHPAIAGFRLRSEIDIGASFITC